MGKHLSLGLLVLFASFKVFACSCAEFNLEKSVNDSESVFFGQITAAKTIYSKNSKEPSEIEGKVKVIEVLKGNLKSTEITITTGVGGGDCGVQLLIPAAYIIFLSKGSNSISMCDGSGPVNNMVSYVDYQELSEKIKAVTKNLEKK